jgi:Transcriptional regulatory protein, C terminal
LAINRIGKVVTSQPQPPAAIRIDLGAIFMSLELSQKTWLTTSLSPGSGEKMSKHSVPAGDIAGLLTGFRQLQDKAFARAGQRFPIIVIQEAGLDGFWIHRVLQAEGIESHVVDAASIATSRRRRRAKTDKIDGEALIRALLAYKRGEPRVCAILKAPTPEIIHAVWGEDHADHQVYLRLAVRRLRRELEPDPVHPRYILTEKGIGYRLVVQSHPAPKIRVKVNKPPEGIPG